MSNVTKCLHVEEILTLYSSGLIRKIETIPLHLQQVG